jgi:Protein of unknown function (DUF2950)
MTVMKHVVALAFVATFATLPAHAQVAAQKTFPTPEAAADALIAAASTFDVEALKSILGPDGVDLVVTQDLVMDKKNAADFAAQAKIKHSVQRDPKNSGKAIIIIGPEDWPGPIPIVASGKAWRFDTKAGREEILFRRIGRDELDAIELCEGYVEAQLEYASTKHDNLPIAQYAQRIVSTPGKQDGLAWKNPDGTWDGPCGENIAQAIEEGYSDKAKPFHGYYFKVLKGQGPGAKFGELDYIVNGVMIGGFALAAAPSDYRVTGVKTFIVNQDGIVYEKDLGPDTLDAFKAMTKFNPDKSWTPVSSR